MPLKIPFTSLVVTGHRGTALTERQDNPLVKLATGQPKDDWATRWAGEPCLLPRPKPRGALPGFSIKRMTDFTRLVDHQALARASRRSTLDLANPDQVVAAVRQHLGERLRSLGQTDDHHTPLILVGEAHGERTSLMMNLATIACVKDRNAIVLLERTRTDVDGVVREAALLDEMIENDLLHCIGTVQSALQDGKSKERMFDILTAYVAAKAGARVGSFDKRHRQASNKNEREAVMEEEIRNRLEAADGPVLVIMGSNHLPYMHDHFDGDVAFVALTTIVGQNENPPSAEHRKRSSYLFANDDILKIRATPALETGPFDALTFAGGLVDLSPTPRPPGSTLSYGIGGPSRFAPPD